MSDRITDLSDLNTIVNSPVIRQVIEKRKSDLQKEVNVFIKQQDWFNAYATVARIGDLEKTMEMFNKKLDELKGK